PTHLLIASLTLLFAGAVLLAPKTTQNPQAAVGILAQFPFQGRLTNTDGTVVADANYDAIFQLYTVDTGGIAVWTENHTGVDQITTADGIFNTLLGSITTLTGIDFNQDEYWLGITVGADAEMSPRIRLGAAPYAFNTDTLDGISGEDYLQLNGQAGGQTVYGGTAASENLVLNSTSHATKGDVIVNDDFVPSTDDTYDLGSSSKRFRDLYLGPTTLHLATTVAETVTARDWKLNVDETNGTTDGDLRIQEGANSYFGITTAGNVVLGSAALATTATNGFLYTPSVPGTPTGVPITYTGRVPLVYNTAANTLYFYNAGWQPVSGGGGISGSGAAGRVTVWSGASAVTSDAEYLYDSTQNRLSIGTTPSTDTVAVLSIPSNKAISARNSANSANVNLIKLGASDQIFLGPTTADTTTFDLTGSTTTTYVFNNSSGNQSNVRIEGNLSVYNTNGMTGGIASTGSINLKNNASISARNAADTADISLFKLGTSDQIAPGFTSGTTSAFDLNFGGETTFLFNNSAANKAHMTIEGTLSVYDSNALSSAVATTGHIRLPNNASLSARNAGNTADISLIRLGTSDQVVIGPTNGTTTTAFDLNGGFETTFNFNNTNVGNKAHVGIEGTLSVYDNNSLTGASTTGHIRLPNNAQVAARNAGNTANVDLIKLTADDYIQLGQTSAGLVELEVGSANGQFRFRNGAGATSGNAS
ncbi:MAG: hypothetical protein AAB701_00550, partial [Patescibacteria group bacterium]